MSYSIHDYFDDRIKVQLLELTEKIKNNDQEKDSNYELFINFIKSILYESWDNIKSESLKRSIIYAMDERENVSISTRMKEIFNLLSDECELKKIEYVDGSDHIIVEYNKDLDGDIDGF